MGMFSTTRSREPRPKLRVTLRSSTPGRPQETQRRLDKVDRDDEEVAKRAEPDNRFGLDSTERDATHDELAFVRSVVALTRDDFAGEKDVFEIEDRKVVIVKFFGSVDGYDVIEFTNTVAHSPDRRLGHSSILPERQCARRG